VKLKIGNDKTNKEYVLVIPNQVTFVFDYAFTSIKIITLEGTKEYSIDTDIKFRYSFRTWIQIGNLSIISGSSFITYVTGNKLYMDLNHQHIKHLIKFILINKPHDFTDVIKEDDIKEVKCFKNRIALIKTDSFRKILVATQSNSINMWQYYMSLQGEFKFVESNDSDCIFEEGYHYQSGNTDIHMTKERNRICVYWEDVMIDMIFDRVSFMNSLTFYQGEAAIDSIYSRYATNLQVGRGYQYIQRSLFLELMNLFLNKGIVFLESKDDEI